MASDFIKWRDEFSVGLEEIDNQHKELINMINELYTSFMNKEHNSKIEEIVQRMTDYTVMHFSTEEKYFTAYNYVDSKEHIEQHKAFVEKVADFKSKLENRTATLTFKIISFLQEWLLNHILKEDTKYKPMLKEAGLVK